ncbi:MAG: alpha/beta hydrolase [Clostridiales bacterium]|nr:alpha/beta hydrolase [Clostridiales bacterium]
MLFKEYGDSNLPVMILLHGGGLSDWSLSRVVEGLSEEYRLVTPVIDGHGEDGGNSFISIEDSAEKLEKYVDERCNGHVFAVGGLSIGAQIVVQALSDRPDIADYAFIESALVYPIKSVAALAVPVYKLSFGLIKKRWFAGIQSKVLFVPKDMFERYFEDSCRMSLESFINITLSNGNYSLKDGIHNTKAKVLIIAGEKEIKIMKKSAALLNRQIAGSLAYIAKGMGHGELSLAWPQEYIRLVRDFMAGDMAILNDESNKRSC